MEEKILQEQIAALDRKMDQLLEFVDLQNRKREEFDDFVSDASIVAKDTFKNSVVLLDKAQVELDSCGITCLIIKLLQNIDTIYEMVDMMESFRDFMKDATPILHQVGLDAVNKMNELDLKGYFDYLNGILRIIDKWILTFTAEDLKKIEGNLDNIAGILRNLSDPQLMSSLNTITKAFTETKMDDALDNKSLWQIFLQLRSKEVRKTLSFALRVVQEANKGSELAK